MAIHVVRLGSPPVAGRLRLGTVRRPPRGIPRTARGPRCGARVSAAPLPAACSALSPFGLAFCGPTEKTLRRLPAR
jgi:hypothetical protein